MEALRYCGNERAMKSAATENTRMAIPVNTMIASTSQPLQAGSFSGFGSGASSAGAAVAVPGARWMGLILAGCAGIPSNEFGNDSGVDDMNSGTGLSGVGRRISVRFIGRSWKHFS